MRIRDLKKHAPAIFAMSPTIFFVLVIYCFGIAWSIWTSFTTSKLLPNNDFAGLAQYRRLFKTTVWEVAMWNVFVFGVLFILGCLLFGFLLAVLIDQKIRYESAFRTVFLMASALSFVVVGLAWQWMLDPTLGVQAVVRALGWESFRLDWLVQKDTAIYALVGAGIWHSAGITMIILLAGLRGIDAEIWKATRVDGIPAWRVYLHIVPGMIRPMIVTATVLLGISAIKVFDLVVVMTDGGPGIATEVPAKYVMDMLFERSNIGQATAAATVMLFAVMVILAPMIMVRFLQRRTREKAYG